MLGLRVLAGVRRLPVCEPVLATQTFGVRFGPTAEQRAAAGRVDEVPLALVGHLVAAPPKDRREVRRLGPQLGLVAGFRPQLKDPSTELAQGARPGRAGAPQDAEQGPD